MDLSDATRTVARTIRHRPSDFFPFYLLGMVVLAIAQVLTYAGLVVLLGYYVVSGRLARFREEIAQVPEPPDPGANPDAFAEWSEQLAPAIEPLVSGPALLIVFGTIVAGAIALLLLSAATSAGQLATCTARLRDRSGTLGGIAGFRRHWLGMVGLYLLEFMLWSTATVLAIALVWVSALVSIALALFVAIFVVLGWIAAAIVIRGVFVFAPVALIVDDATPLGALRRSIGFIRAEFANAVIYYAVAIGVLIVFSGVSGTFAALGAPAFSSLASFLVVIPVLDLLKTSFYGDYRGTIDPPSGSEMGLGTQISAGLGRGLRETRAFVRTAPAAHGVSLILLLIGLVAGWLAVEPLVGIVETSIGERLALLFGPTAPLYFFSNNLTVAISITMGGLALGLPAAALLFTNGFMIAAIARLEPAPFELLAFVIPHGIFEFPAIIIAGALGLHLGAAFWRTWLGSADREHLAAALRRSVWVLVGIAILLAVAAVIEGYVSPYYYRPFL